MLLSIQLGILRIVVGTPKASEEVVTIPLYSWEYKGKYLLIPRQGIGDRPKDDGTQVQLVSY